MASSELIKKARANMLRLVAMELQKNAFTPGPDAGGGMPPPGATAMPGGSMPPDPAATGGAPPMDPNAGGAPPMDPSMGGAPPAGGDGTGGPPIVQVNLNDLMQMVQMMQGGGGGGAAPAPGGAPAPAGAPNEPEKTKGGGAAAKGQALEGKIDALAASINMMIGLIAGQMGMNPQQLLEGGGAPPAMGGSAEAAAGGEGGEGLIPPAPGGEAPPAAPPLQPQASARRPQADRLHSLVGSLLR
jgi:hypothetical protein